MNAYTHIWNLVLRGAPESLPASTTPVGYSTLGVFISPLSQNTDAKRNVLFCQDQEPGLPENARCLVSLSLRELSR